jgi:hypothetical protein
MKPKEKLHTLLLLLLAVTGTVHATVRYVNVNNTRPSSPYTGWSSAAVTIQAAVDVSVNGDTVLVTNGVYQTGGRLAGGDSTTNRVAVGKQVTVMSVNGPSVTVIRGQKAAGGGNGVGAMRCVYLTNGAVLMGFTLTNGATTSSSHGGGVYCVSSAVVSNCVLAANSANSGGGSYCGMLNNCTLKDNSAGNGGGSYSSTLNNCTLAGNSATNYGGGSYSGTLNNCTLTGNSASYYGGGSYSGALNNCIVYYNTSLISPNYYSSTLSYCCTTPLPTNGTGNIINAPQLASVSHLSAGSPCIGKGTTIIASGVDIDSEAWASPPSIGCDEYRTGAVTGPLSASIRSDSTNATIGYSFNFVAETSGRTCGTRWDFGDGTVISNQAFVSHAWAVAGDYSVVLTAYNESYPGGVSTSLTINAVKEEVHYVAVNSVNPQWPYASWSTAATNIQQAVDATILPGALVLVSNGVYETGGRLAAGNSTTNRVSVDKPVTVRSVNGPAVTLIRGRKAPGGGNGVGAIRCVYLTNGAVIMGFTLTNGATTSSSGGVYCESSAVVSNCVLTGNSAYYGGGSCFGTLNNCILTGNSAFYYGGGSFYGTLNNCMLTGNSADYGGGSYDGTLNNCTLTGNSADYGGGSFYGTLNNCTLTGNSGFYYGGGSLLGTLNNCIVYYNTANLGPNFYSVTLSYCCTTPLAIGTGNITNAPLFVNRTGGNLRLQTNSPCINAGLNAAAPASIDLDGNPRIVGGTVDMGAYECQSPSSTLSYAWAQRFGLPTDGSADRTDTDGDGLNNWQEWKCLTDPTNSLSVLKIQPTVPTNTSVTVTWQSVAGVSYFIDRSTNLSGTPPFRPLATNLPGASGTTRFTDTNAPRSAPLFYRVGVGEHP